MTRERDQGTTAQAVSEAVNGLCLFLCGPSFRSLGADAPALLAQWDAEYAPILRMVTVPASRGGAPRLGGALQRLSAIARAGFDPGVPEQVKPLRAAVREALAAVGIPLPALTSAGTAVCELHGEDCPARGGRA